MFQFGTYTWIPTQSGDIERRMPVAVTASLQEYKSDVLMMLIT